ncbi:recombinase A [Vibrio sp. UCD-FRSSP16_10]|uniref:RecX family transcriptional regulator n=1 Tax=unclassified Vibrio TaxID=2614977 RepID=UPI0007FF7E47|nr:MULTISPECIES: RecX family transcriptional regulator [unclassified Vibrio]OBT17208.1 recombinase A [Vibrio sp. UCD-FRSSP16_30]OBT22977.1 recombinase A [Vibrio sp. UCD-FRSSP16_10]
MKNNPNGIKKATRQESVMNSAMWHLTQRDMTESELLIKLNAKTDNQDWINQTLESLRSYGYLKSDMDFAQQFTEQSFNNEYGSKYILGKLKHKGVDESTSLIAIEQVKQQYNIDEQAIVIQRINSQYNEFTISREKLVNALLKRGFTFQQIQIAIEQHPASNSLRSSLEIKADKVDLEKEVLKYARKGKGLTVIRQELKQRKVDITDLEDIVNNAINKGDIDFYSSCLEQLQKKKYDLKDFKQRTKAYAMLSRKGFASDEIKFALEEEA